MSVFSDSEVPQPPPTPILPDQPSHLEDSSLINQSRLSMASRQADSFLAPPPPPEIPPTPAQPEIHPEEPVFPPSDEPVPFPDTEPSLPPMAASVSDDEDNDDVASLPSVHEDDNDSADDQEEQEIFGTELPDDPSAAEQVSWTLHCNIDSNSILATEIISGKGPCTSMYLDTGTLFANALCRQDWIGQELCFLALFIVKT